MVENKSVSFRLEEGVRFSIKHLAREKHAFPQPNTDLKKKKNYSTNKQTKICLTEH